jgi:hypothetical protein
VPARVVVQGRHNLEAVFGVEPRSLKRERGENDLIANRLRASCSATESNRVPSPCLRRDSSTQNRRISMQAPQVFPQIRPTPTLEPPAAAFARSGATPRPAFDADLSRGFRV